MNAINKYKIRTDISKQIFDSTLYRIEALRDFCQVKKGDLGGWIEKEDNLSQRGTCWVFDDAMVFQNAKVTGNALICENAVVYGNAKVWGNSKVSGDTKVLDNTEIYNNTVIKQ